MSFMQARVLEGVYKVKFGLFGKVADAVVKLENNETNYKATLNIKATGISKYLSKNRVEQYTSEGFIENGEYRPVKFYKMVKNQKKHYTREYEVNYKDKILTYTSKNKKANTSSKVKLDYFTNNDLMTIFLNMDKLVDFNQTKQKIKVIYSKKDKREIELEIPKDKKKAKLKSFLKAKHDIILIATINQKIFSSSKGELILSLDKYNVCHKAILKDVLLFGDIKAELVSYDIKE